MVEAQFQQALANLLTNQELRQSVFAGESDRLTDFDLTPDQRHCLSTLNQERVEIYSELLVINRLTKAIDGLPWTMNLLGAEAWTVINDFNQATPPKSAKKFEEATAFGRYLASRLETDPVGPPFLSDVLAYEMNSLELRFCFDGTFEQSGVEVYEMISFPLEDELQREMVPKRLLHHRILNFNYDVEWIGEELDAGRTPDAIERQTNYVLLHVNPAGAVNAEQINVPTSLFIEACDGRTSLAEVIERLASEFGSSKKQFPQFKERCLELCESLVDRRIISLCKAFAQSNRREKIWQAVEGSHLRPAD